MLQWVWILFLWLFEKMPEFHVKLEQLSNNLLQYICKRPSQEPHYQTNLFVADNPIRIWLLSEIMFQKLKKKTFTRSDREVFKWRWCTINDIQQLKEHRPWLVKLLRERIQSHLKGLHVPSYDKLCCCKLLFWKACIGQSHNLFHWCYDKVGFSYM